MTNQQTIGSLRRDGRQSVSGATGRRPNPPRVGIAAVGLAAVMVLSGCGVLGDNDGDTVSAVDTNDVSATADTPEDEATAKEVLVITGEKDPSVVVTAPDGDNQETADDGSDADNTAGTDPTGEDTATGGSDDASTTTEPSTTERAFPDCSDGCNYVMEGDSITFNLSQWLWPKFCDEVSAATCVNSGISGHRIDQMIETARGDVDIHLGPGSNDVLIFWGGTNDLWQKFHSEDPAEGARGAYESTKAYIAERREKGWDYVVILTHPPMNRDIVAGWEVLNDLIRTNDAGADTVIDVAPDPRLADPFDPVMKSTDGVHYKDPGRQVVVEGYLIPTIRELSGR
ncbi:MAG: SGNH/GDSL hydrolase family protein [Actinomycetota bacterium]